MVKKSTNTETSSSSAFDAELWEIARVDDRQDGHSLSDAGIRATR